MPPSTQQCTKFTDTFDPNFPSIFYPTNHEISPVLLHCTSDQPNPYQLSLNYGIPTTRVSNWKTNPPIPPPTQPLPRQMPTTLLGKIRQSLPTYAPTLWSQLTLTTDHSDSYLAQYISQNQGQLLIITDASLNAQKFSVFFPGQLLQLHKISGLVMEQPQGHAEMRTWVEQKDMAFYLH